MNESGLLEGGACDSFGVDFDFRGNKISTKNKYQDVGTSIDFLTKNKYLQIPNYIKIDLDGIEYIILVGGMETFESKEINEILIELNEGFSKEYIKCTELLFEFGFKFKNKYKQVSPLTSNSNMYNCTFERVYESGK